MLRLAVFGAVGFFSVFMSPKDRLRPLGESGHPALRKQGTIDCRWCLTALGFIRSPPPGLRGGWLRSRRRGSFLKEGNGDEKE